MSVTDTRMDRKICVFASNKILPNQFVVNCSPSTCEYNYYARPGEHEPPSEGASCTDAFKDASCAPLAWHNFLPNLHPLSPPSPQGGRRGWPALGAKEVDPVL